MFGVVAMDKSILVESSTRRMPSNNTCSNEVARGDTLNIMTSYLRRLYNPECVRPKRNRSRL